MSPFLSPRNYPTWTLRPLARLLLWLPNQFWWWDDELREELPGPRFTYPRYPSHAIAEILRLSLAVQGQAERTPPASARILVIINSGERESVDNAVVAALEEKWQAQGMAQITSFNFSARLNLEHDYITIFESEEFRYPPDALYPVIIERIQLAEADVN
jgi:hypothetical protein